MSAPLGPLVKASFTKSITSALPDLGPSKSARVIGRMPSDVLARVESSLRGEWLPGESLIAFDVAIYDELGPDGLVQFWRSFAAASTRVPILRPIADSALRIFGSPSGILKLVPRSWTLLTRDFGRMLAEETESRKHMRLRLVEVPVLSRPELFNLAQRGSYLGILDLLGARGSVTPDTAEIEMGRYSYDIEWD